jgi:hypothetical protein
MRLVVEQAERARSLVPNQMDSPQVYDARQRIKKVGFGDLRTSFIRLGGELTEPFHRLDAEIDHFSAQWSTQAGTTSGAIRLGIYHDFLESLDRITTLANALADAAATGKELNKKISSIYSRVLNAPLARRLPRQERFSDGSQKPFAPFLIRTSQRSREAERQRSVK